MKVMNSRNSDARSHVRINTSKL